MTYTLNFPYSNFFGEVNNLGKNENDNVTIQNKRGFSSISFYCSVPIGGIVTFEATYDGIHWEAISIRSTTYDVISKNASTSGKFIGSIAGVRQFRFRTSTAGSANGTVMGVMQRDAAVLEGIEFGPPPHKFGYTPIHVDASYTTAQTNTILFTADTGEYSVVTDLYIVVSGTNDGTIKIFDETDSSGNYLFKAGVSLSNQQPSFVFSHSFVTPYISSATGNSWKLTTSVDLIIDIIGHGYQF